MDCEVCKLRELFTTPAPEPEPTRSSMTSVPPAARIGALTLSVPDQLAHVEAHLFDALDRVAQLEAKVFSTAQPSAARGAARTA
jgi:hypothetical protein